MSTADRVSIRGAIGPDALRILTRFQALVVVSAGGVRNRQVGTATVSVGDVSRRVRIEPLGYVDAGDAWQVAHGAAAGTLGEGLIVTADGMTEEARRILRDHGIAYATGSGYLHLWFPPLCVDVGVWRPATSRGPRSRVRLSGKGGLVAQALLFDRGRTWHVREAASAAGVSAGMAHRVISRLEEDGVVVRDGVGARPGYRVVDRQRLLDAWCDEQVDRGVETLSCVLKTDEPARRVALLAERFGATVPYAVTGWAAVTAMTGRPLQTASLAVWVEEAVAWDEALSALGAMPVSHDGTVILMRLAGDYPLAFRRASRGVWCVNPIRLHYDLRSSAGRDDVTLRQLREAIVGVGTA